MRYHPPATQRSRTCSLTHELLFAVLVLVPHFLHKRCRLPVSALGHGLALITGMLLIALNSFLQVVLETASESALLRLRLDLDVCHLTLVIQLQLLENRLQFLQGRLLNLCCLLCNILQ